MAEYLVRFIPLEPYFFGGERSGVYGKESYYFTKSEVMPNQSTILGAIRYCCIDKPSYDFKIDESKIKIGRESFSIESPTLQDFGWIKSVSPIFFMDGDEIYIPTPFDHNCEKGNIYTPFQEFEQVLTGEGIKYFPKDYKAKLGITDSFMNISGDNRLKEKEDFFSDEDRIGINTKWEENGLFKRKYMRLKEGKSYGVFAQIDDQVKMEQKIVYMGQGKSAFCVKFEKRKNDLVEKVKNVLNRESLGSEERIFYYALSDLYIKEKEEYLKEKEKSNVQKLNDCCYYANVKVKEYRSFRTNKNAKSHRDRHDVLQHLIKAGSILLVKREKREDFESLIKNDNCEQIGFNYIIKIES